MARIRTFPKSHARRFLGRARQYHRQLAHALEQGDSEAAALLAVHLAIASADALTCSRAGRVWSGEDHRGAVELLRESGGSNSDVARALLAAVLEAKTRVEYGPDLSTPESVRVLARRAERLFSLSESIVASALGPSSKP